MKKPDNQHDELADIREHIIGLGERSIRKSYYPELLEKLADLERFKTLLDQSNDAIFLIEIPSGRLIYASKSACAQIGYTEERCLSLTMYDIIPENPEKLYTIFSGETDSIVFDATLQKMSGEKTPYELNMHTVMFKDREYVVSIARDITERKQAEKALRQQASLIDLSPDGIFVRRRDGTITSWSKGAESLYGWARDEAIGKKTQSLLKTQYPRPLEEIERQLQQTGRWSGELIHATKDGRRVTVQSWWLVRDGQQENRAEILESNVDITERKRAEEELRESEEKFRALAESSTAAIFVYQGEWLVSVNPAAELITGYLKDELLKMRTIDIIHPDFKEMVKKRALARQRGEPEPSQYETMIITKSGEARWALLSVGLMLYRGKPAGVVTLLDITERKRAEEALRKSEAHLARSQEIAHLGSFEWDLVHRKDEWSDETYRIFGVKPGEVKLSLETYMHFIYPEDREAVKKHAENILINKKFTGGYDARIIRPDGTLRWIRLDGELVYDETGIPIRLFGTITDITERKRTEEVLMVSETKYRIVADNTYDWEFWMGLEGQYNYTSPSCERITGYAASEFMADPDLFQRIIHPDDREVYHQHNREINETLRPGEMEFRVVRKDGNVRWIHHVCQPVFDHLGRYIGIRGSNRDSTDRKQAEIDRERLLREIDGERRRLQTILESLPVSVFIVDKAGRIVLTNPFVRSYWKGTFPRTVEELVKSGALWSGNSKPFYAEGSGLTRALRTGETTVNEVLEFEREKGVHFTLMCSTAPVLDARGDITGAVVIWADITEIRKLEKALGESKHQAELYLDLMGHDITNMNHALMGYLEMIEVMRESGEIDPALIGNSIEIINRSSRMISDVKKLTRLQGGMIPRKNVDACKILSGVKSRYSSVLNRPVTINYAPGENCIVRAGDLLEDVFDNLVDNAIRHSTGPVTIDLAVDQAVLEGRRYYLITVADTGPGIPDDLKKKMFTTLREIGEKPERRGFGLYLIKTVIDYFYGQVWVEDRVPGDHTKGARFVVMLQAAGQ